MSGIYFKSGGGENTKTKRFTLDYSTLGPKVTFRKQNYEDVVDVIIPGELEIARGATQGIYNAVYDEGWNNYGPSGTSWNSIYTDSQRNGWNNLTNLFNRIFDDFIYALNEAIGDNIIGLELILQENNTNRMWMIKFTEWTQGNNGGGFAYERYEVFSKTEVVLNPGESDVISNGLILKADSDGLYNSLSESSYNYALSPANTEWNSWSTDNANNGKDAFDKLRTALFDKWDVAVSGNPYNLYGEGSQELIMHDLTTDFYWYILVSYWGGDGSISYTRQVIPNYGGIIFSDGTTMFTAPVINVSYSNVIFVDYYNGNDTTGEIGNFLKPASSIYKASLLAGSGQSNSKILIHVRKGNYSFNGPLNNYVDYYFEPGCIISGGQITDNTAAITSNIYGYAELQNVFLNITGGSTFNMEFNTWSNNAAMVSIGHASRASVVNLKGKSMSAGTTNGSGYGLTIRYNSEVTINVDRYIQAAHQVFLFRFYTGKTTINCPNVNLLAGNIYGGAFKQIIQLTDVATTGTVIVNGNLQNLDTVDYGSTGSALTYYYPGAAKVIVNGNIIGGVTKAVDGNVPVGGSITVNGNISSNHSQGTLWAYGAGTLLFKNGLIANLGGVSTPSLIVTNNTATIFFNNCQMYNATTDSSLINMSSTTAQLVLDGVSGFTEGTGGFSVFSGASAATNIRVNNSRFNKDKSTDITDLYTPSGLIYDLQTITLKTF